MTRPRLPMLASHTASTTAPSATFNLSVRAETKPHADLFQLVSYFVVQKLSIGLRPRNLLPLLSVNYRSFPVNLTEVLFDLQFIPDEKVQGQQVRAGNALSPHLVRYFFR